MRVVVRHITRKSGTGVGHADREIQTDVLTIGRGSDADVFLSDIRVALHHAVLRRDSKNRFSVQARTPSGIRINGRTTQAGVVRTGDTIGVGQSTLRLERADSGHDLVVEIEEARTRGGERPATGATSLRATGLRRRPWAWALFLLLLAVGLGLPVAQIYRDHGATDSRGTGSQAMEWARDDGTVIGKPTLEPLAGSDRIGRYIRWLPTGGDRLWDSGPVSQPHRFFGRNCVQCHRQPFQRVTNAACLDCHAGEPHHADDPDLMRAAGLSGRRCASCHIEHSGTAALRADDPALCSNCHSEPATNMPGSRLQAVSGFVDRQHPQFRVRLVSAGAGDQASWERIRMDGAIAEDSGLIFPHDVHMDAQGIDGPNGEEHLTCADCHKPGPAGVAMQPVRFEQNCQRCHRLDFEPETPNRQLPHGQPEQVLDRIEEYYARVALAGGFSPRTDIQVQPPGVVRRERPAVEELDERERRTALAWAREQAEVVAREVFEYRTCKTCHGVTRTPDDPAGWKIAPVTFTQDWFPHAGFTHARHEQSQCTVCHTANDSDSATDVLMPRIDTCQQCHGSPDPRARSASGCTECHGFHNADELEMGLQHATGGAS